eukprot:2144065-Amphidinium_carterae.1
MTLLGMQTARMKAACDVSTATIMKKGHAALYPIIAKALIYSDAMAVVVDLRIIWPWLMMSPTP